MTEETIYVALLCEGLEVRRPVKARRLSGDRYLILEQEYDRDVETWASEPGTVVECRRELRDGRELMIALRPAEGIEATPDHRSELRRDSRGSYSGELAALGEPVPRSRRGQG